MTDLIPSGMLPGAAILAGIILLVETWWHGRAGSAAFGNGGGAVLREDNPVGFWLMIGVKVLVGLFAVWLGFHFG